MSRLEKDFCIERYTPFEKQSMLNQAFYITNKLKTSAENIKQ